MQICLGKHNNLKEPAFGCRINRRKIKIGRGAWDCWKYYQNITSRGVWNKKVDLK